ncbi:MAG: DUF58 domain-containing protein [Gammaproteobacteria bacterium]|nr:DUF58 domain-containing protein [Gammaproteobacteria bacterium]
MHLEANMNTLKYLLNELFYGLKPGNTLFILLGLLTLIGLISSVWNELLWLWYISLILLVLLLIWDLIRLYSIHLIWGEREVPTKMSLGLWHDVTLRLSYQSTYFSNKKIHLNIFDHYPVNCKLKDMPQKLTLYSDQYAVLKYAIKPVKRGNEYFLGMQCLIQSPWSIWLRNHFVPNISKTMVYPNFSSISQYALLATDNLLSQLGIKKIRRRGEGMDFNQLREYRAGDPLKQIDWKATSRLQKLISKEYQDEKDQEIIFLLDCGRRMLSHDDELSHFDHSLNAMLLLSYVALHHGDAVGFSTFATKNNQNAQRWLPAKKGMSTIHNLLNNVYDLQANTVTPDYTQGVSQVLLKQKKRALIIVLTNLRSEDSDDLLNALKLLKHKHLVILASLKEQALEQVLDKPVNDFSEALLLASTCDYQSQQRILFDQLYTHGINIIDVTPDKLAIKLVNRYLEIKTSGQL